MFHLEGFQTPFRKDNASYEIITKRLKKQKGSLLRLAWQAPSSIARRGFTQLLAGIEDMHLSLDEFEFRPGPNSDYRVSCP